MILIITTLFFTYALIAYQDIKDRAVYWILFPIVGLLMGLLFYKNVSSSVYIIGVQINLIMVTTILSILYIYTTFVRGKVFLNVSIGLGDILFFYAFAFGFPTITFLLLFVSAVLFSLILSQVKIKNAIPKTIPLAGFMSVFLIGVYTCSLLSFSSSLFTL